MKIKTKEMFKAFQELENFRRYYDYRRESDREKLRDLLGILGKAEQPLATALDETQKRARVRIVTAENVLSWLYNVEHELNISKKAMEGVTVTLNPDGQTFPGRYKGTPESTYVLAEYKRGEWIITSIFRGECRSWKRKITLTEEAKKAIISRIEG